MRVSAGFVVLLLAAPAGAAPAPSQSDPDNALVARLIAALADPDVDVRLNLAYALAKIGTPSIEPLVAALRDEAPERRAGAAYTLGLIGPAARAALPALLDVLADPDVEVRRQASYAIGRMIPARSEPAAVKRLASAPIAAPPARGKP